MAAKERTASETEALLTEIRERFDYAWDNWKDIRDAGDIDMRTVAGDPWKPEDRAARDAANRPCLSLDELGQYFNQIINEVLANPIAMKFDPTGNGANDDGAEFYADKSREIEYRSHAQIAYTTAFQNTIHRGYGWCRLNTKRAHIKTRNQEIWISDIPDPNAVVPDPDAKRPDSSDIKYLFYIESHTVSEFKRRWKHAKITDFTGDVATLAPSWLKGEKVQVAEYWTIKMKARKLGLFKLVDGSMLEEFEDELAKIPAGAVRAGDSIEVDEPRVCQYITNGVEILETNEWAGKFIPFASCFGPVLYLTENGLTKRIIMSMTRLAHDPYMLYCYYRTAQAEVVGRATKNAATGYKGQFSGHEEEWAKSVHEPMSYLEVEAVTEATGSQILPLPVMNNWEPPIQALEMGAEGARRAIQAAMGGSPLPTQAQRRNEKSGVALKQMESSTQKGSFHFIQHYRDMIQHVGVMVEDLMDKIYDTARDVGIRKADESAQTVRINDPQAIDPKTQHPVNISTKGDYLVTVSTGPAHESQREAASDFADQLVQNPQVFPLIASEVVRLKNLGPIGDEIADALDVLKPPELRKQKDGSAPLPPEAQQAMAENAQLKQQLQQAAQAIQTDQAKQQGQIQIAQQREQGEMERARMDGDIKIRIAAMNNETDLRKEEMKLRGVAMQAEIDAAQAQLNAQLTGQADERGRQHEAGMAAMSAEQAAQQSAQGHQQALEQGDVSHEQQMQAGEIEAQRAAEQAAADAAAQGGVA